VFVVALGAEQAKQPAAQPQTHVAVEPTTTTTTEELATNVLSVPAASSDRRPSIEMIPALCTDLGPSGRAAPSEAVLASEEDSMSEADSPSGLDDQPDQAR